MIPGGGGDGGQHGQPDGDTQFKVKWRRLQQIRAVITGWRKGTMPTRLGNAIGLGTIACFAVLGIAEGLNRLGLHIHSPLSLGLSLIGGLAVYRYISMYSTAPRTHAEHVDLLLAAYDPVDKEVFRTLQHKIEKRGIFDPELVSMWTDIKADAIQAAAGCAGRWTADRGRQPASAFSAGVHATCREAVRHERGGGSGNPEGDGSGGGWPPDRRWGNPQPANDGPAGTSGLVLGHREGRLDRLYSAWSSWRKTQGPDAAAAREFVAYISTGLPSLDDASAALAPAARAGDWEVLLTAFANVASAAPTPDQLGKLDGFMQQTLALCGTEGGAAECSSPAFLAALNALAPSLARSFVVRVVGDADACGMPRDQALRPSIEQVLKANDTTPWCL